MKKLYSINKKLCSVIILVLLLFTLLNYMCFQSTDFIRIHIVANSNSTIDQAVKLQVRDVVAQYIDDNLNENSSFYEVKQFVSQNEGNIENIANTFLIQQNAPYEANARFCELPYPTRKYGNVIFPSGNYKSIEVTLGEGKGDNWWCVVYPPMCFTNGKDISGNKVVYKSKIYEILNSR